MFIADLHIHSKYSMATSRESDPEHIDWWARNKGVALVGTGDCTHPGWRNELREALIPAEDGLYRLRDERALPCYVAGEVVTPRFVTTGEISTVYTKDGRTRRVHHLILLPGLDEADAFARRLEKVGNIASDGRPILKLDSRDLLEMLLDSCPQAILIPAHIWTPHYSALGAFSQFDSPDACYGDLAGHVRALETGLSADPAMIRRVSSLDRYALVSNSDAHAPAKLAREANLLDCALSYPALKRAIETGEGLRGTIEFFPEEGKYYLDGHRACGYCATPEEAAQRAGRCPVCGGLLTSGVLNRVNALADRTQATDAYFESLMPLTELLGECLGASPTSKRVQAAYMDMLGLLGAELHILREADQREIARVAGDHIAEAIRRLRAGRALRTPGYDGKYGRVTLFSPNECEKSSDVLSPASRRSDHA